MTPFCAGYLLAARAGRPEPFTQKSLALARRECAAFYKAHAAVIVTHMLRTGCSLERMGVYLWSARNAGAHPAGPIARAAHALGPVEAMLYRRKLHLL